MLQFSFIPPSTYNTRRDQSFASIFTGTQSPIHHSNFMIALDDSLETFMNQTPDKVRVKRASESNNGVQAANGLAH